MTWPCPDCGEPFTFDHCCPEMRLYLSAPDAPLTWRFLARVLMLQLETAERAFQVEQSLRVQQDTGPSG